MLSSKVVRTAIAALIACSLFLTFYWKADSLPDFRSSFKDAIEQPAGDPLTEFEPPAPIGNGRGRLHLLVPATSSNVDLCKLMVSAQILGYPTPVLINFGDDEEEDPYVQHLGKVEGLLEYLQRLEDSSDYDTDFVLIVDGYDGWFQLMPDVLIKRYYEVVKQADARAKKIYGEEVAESNGMTHSIVIGPDKVCWPVDFSRPACWAVPGTTLSRYAFGPQSHNGRDDNNDPKWLNSGTIIGPAQDLKEFLQATLDLIHEDPSVTSDQYYMAQLFGLQEFARLSHNQTRMHEFRDTRYNVELEHPDDTGLMRFEPSIKADVKTEYHILIDGESSLFQTLAFWKQYLTFMTPSHSWYPMRNGTNMTDPTIFNPYHAEIPSDIEDSTKPLNLSSNDIARTLSWSQTELLYNTISHRFPVLIHFTGEKKYRDVWWQRMWFQSSAAELRQASAKLLDYGITADGEQIDGKTWVKAESQHAEEYREAGISGAESDRRGWLSWRTMCGIHEGVLYEQRDQTRFFHPIAPAPSEEEEADIFPLQASTPDDADEPGDAGG